jgi:hypothetical protein
VSFWHGREYHTLWSFDPHYGDELASAGEVYLWFYPMRENRRVLRTPPLELIAALREESRWLLAHLEHASTDAHAELQAGLSHGLVLLDRAHSRLSAPTQISH